MTDPRSRQYRDEVLAQILRACQSKISEFELLNQEQIRESQILEILDWAIDRYSKAVLSAKGIDGVTKSERTGMQTRLSRRAVNVDQDKQTVVLESEYSRANRWIRDRTPEWLRWNNYRALLLSEGKSQKVISEHQEVILKALDSSGDPLGEARPARKGLIMGNVQSGKTMNFIGLINKALDAGYHSVIVLGGHMNELRKQAQQRIDEGVIDLDKCDTSVATGIGLNAFTDEENDLKKNAVRRRLNLTAAPGIYVIKKNVTILQTLIEEIKESSAQEITSLPMLLVDDEADYASINTKYSKNDYAATNREIRKLLSLFNKATYVAYTATPFANVFIPFKETVSGVVNDDLFPSDFIIRMPTPKNYRGQDFFFPDDGELGLGPCRGIQQKELDEWLPVKHKKDHEVNSLHSQLIEAVHSFFLAIAVRHLRGQENSHNTMLVNVSRFNDVQRDVAKELLELKDDIERELKSFAGLSPAEACLQSPHIESMSALFHKEFDQSGHNFEEILDVLHTAVVDHGVEVELVNGLVKRDVKKKGSLDYESHKKLGLWVIAVGGLKLSRGLTLEGLTTSFFSRNSLAYDTLTQMCRWFGYRDGYEDVCRLYLLSESWDHYCHVADSIRQLDKELLTMRLARATPADFGLKVQTSEAALLITAKNKLGNAKPIDFKYRLWGEVVNGLRARENAEVAAENLRVTNNHLSGWRSSAENYRKKKKSHIFERVSYESVIGLLRSLDVPRVGLHKNINPILHALSAMSQRQAELPTVILFSRQRADVHKYIQHTSMSDGGLVSPEFSVPVSFDDSPVNGITRVMSQKDGVLYSPNTLIGDSDDLSLLFGEDLRDNTLARATQMSGPVLVIYLYRALVKNDGAGPREYRLANEKSPVNVGYSLHFPSKARANIEVPEMDTKQQYYVNEIFQQELQLEDASDEDEEIVDE